MGKEEIEPAENYLRSNLESLERQHTILKSYFWSYDIVGFIPI